MTIGTNIRNLRREQGLTQAELAERVGLGRPAISAMEQGQRSVAVEEAQALARALGVSLTSLLGEEEAGPDESLTRAYLDERLDKIEAALESNFYALARVVVDLQSLIERKARFNV